MSLDEFKWVWKDTSKDEILQQYYFDYINWKSVVKEWSDVVNEAIEYIKKQEIHPILQENKIMYRLNTIETKELLNILQNGSEK